MEINNIIKDITSSNHALTEEELDAVYYYLSETWEEMSQEDQAFWIEIINKFDPW